MKQLAEDLGSFGHRVTVLTSFPHYDGNEIRKDYRGKIWAKETLDGITAIRTYLFVPKHKNSIPGRFLNYMTWNLFSGLAGLLVGSHDILFAASPPLSNGTVASLIARIRGIPSIYCVQDIYPDIAVRLGVLKGKRAIRYFRDVEKRVYSSSAAISVISEGFRQNLLAKEVPDNKIHIIPNFVDTDFIHPEDRHNAFSTAHKLDDHFVVLFAGNMGLSQGLESVIEAALLLRDQREIVFSFVGNGTAKPSLMDLAETLKLKNVRFSPFFPQRDIPELYASSDVCLVPLRKGFTEESVPSKTYTILSAARPVIASVDAGSEIWRLVEEAACGLCVEPENPRRWRRP